jgi:hypothetical protein
MPLYAPISDIWRMKLRPLTPPIKPTRLSAYTGIAGTDIDRSDLCKPAAYQIADNQITPECLFRIRTQHSNEVRTHQHLRSINGRLTHSSFGDRNCPFCHSAAITGTEAHHLLACSRTRPSMEPLYVPFQNLLNSSSSSKAQGNGGPRDRRSTRLQRGFRGL